MEMIIDFPGGSRVDAHFGNFTVATDQPPVASAPTPFAVFLASIGTCAGIYVLGFCRQRGLSADGIHIVERVHSNPYNGMVDKIDLEIQVPPTFPEKYRDSLVRSAELCAVKKHLENPPKFEITTQVAAAVAG
jgi:putative redox protein